MKRYLRQINEACSVYDLREALRKSRVMNESISSGISERIKFLENLATSKMEFESLEDLRDELELKVEASYPMRQVEKREIVDFDCEDDLLGDFDASKERDLWARVEKQLIFRTLRDNSDNRTRAAKCLGISIRTLRNKLALYLGRLDGCPSENYGKHTPFYRGGDSAQT